MIGDWSFTNGKEPSSNVQLPSVCFEEPQSTSYKFRACAEPHILFIKPKTHSHGAVPSSDKGIFFSISHCSLVEIAYMASRVEIIKQSNIGSLKSQDFFTRRISKICHLCQKKLVKTVFISRQQLIY